ncbi:alpha/beta hydrolase family protein [Actinocrispum wychmicini]|uniref:Dipeptidyl aminopeptidase/acylaminoacyl peptidase n=1 Tax=Actinocrispum wychmicini TaxID=1213861 RepID=A0A4R2JKK5_9PSEU|nr:prolyl oligopeptidase family serine peptidase [Actinocrispum wychmicini]TCO60563.1 dipeptidyl aminopeptidase/acylaminoacyl peptidase [Actinocrispum wychmicini]
MKVAPYGTWTSPISAADVAGVVGAPDWVELHGGHVWWTRSRPEEGGRVSLFRLVDGEVQDVLPGDWNVRNRVHEYGGRPWAPVGDQIVFTHWTDQRVYTVHIGGEPLPITDVPECEHGWRYSDLTAGVGAEVWCVRETVIGDRPTDIERHLVAVPLDGSGTRVLGATHHFMTAPKPSPDGTHAAWIGWDHPRMPWDGTELCVAPIQPDGTFGPHRVMAGGPRESVCQFEWDGPAALLAMTDPDGWWNLHRVSLDGTTTNLAPCQEELGGPLWALGWRWFTSLGNGRYAVLRAGRLAVLDENTRTVTDVDVDLPVWGPSLTAADGMLACTAAGPTENWGVVQLDVRDPASTLRRLSPAGDLPVAYLPVGYEQVFTGPDGREIPAVVYPPTNPDFVAPDGELPPYVVHVHGGPTAQFTPVLVRVFGYLASRGIGIVAVNHGGSAGYGRAFRELLDEQWGVVDVDDCAAVASALADQGIADRARLAVRGHSAGGWTGALSIVRTNVYRCATMTCPLLDLESWSEQTHDFESRYMERLIGALPEHKDRYSERSPMTYVDNVTTPVLVLQGAEDKICPASDSARYIARLAAAGAPYAHLVFEGEGHGFRRAENVARVAEAELSFYGQVFGFSPVGVPVLPVHNG